MRIFLFRQNTTDSNEDETPPPGVHENSGRRKRDAELDLVTSPPTFTATISDRTLPTSVTASNPTHSTNQITNTDAQPAADSTVTEKPSTSHTSASHSNSTDIQSTDSTVFETSALSLTSVPPATLPPWLMGKTHAGDVSSGTSASALTPGQQRFSTYDKSITGHFSTRSAGASGTTGGRHCFNTA